jgi:plasmid stabilization system protein ParE
LNIESLRIHPAALEEVEAAADWYAQRSRRTAERFLDELDLAIDQIARGRRRPDIGATVWDDARVVRRLLHRSRVVRVARNPTGLQ